MAYLVDHHLLYSLPNEGGGGEHNHLARWDRDGKWADEPLLVGRQLVEGKFGNESNALSWVIGSYCPLPREPKHPQKSMLI